MLDRHAVQSLLKAGVASQKIARQYGVSQRTIQRIGEETPVEAVDETESRQARRVGRPGIGEPDCRDMDVIGTRP